MKCPVCKTVHLRLLDSEELPRRTVCERCGGQWIKADQYWQWLHAQGENLPEKPPDPEEWLPSQDSASAKLCPECGHFLSRARVGHGVTFCLDRCGSCGGIWFDKNEWEFLRSRNLHDDVHFIFSTAWQHKIVEQENKEAYEMRIAVVLGATDYQRVLHFKTWANGHAKRGTIMAFLADLDR